MVLSGLKLRDLLINLGRENEETKISAPNIYIDNCNFYSDYGLCTTG